MRKRLLALAMVGVAHLAAAQTRPAAEFQLTKITKNLISTLQFAYTGAGFTRLLMRPVQETGTK
jgi:hypothetical protein